MCVAKTKALISYAVTLQLICAIVFTWGKLRFSHDPAQLLVYKCQFDDCFMLQMDLRINENAGFIMYLPCGQLFLERIS